MKLEPLDLKLSKIAIITRDGLLYHEFIRKHGLLESQCIRIKSYPLITNFEYIKGYLILHPTPPGTNEILELFEMNEVPNLSKKYLI